MHSQNNFLRSTELTLAMLSRSPAYNAAASSDFAARPRLSARSTAPRAGTLREPDAERRRNSGLAALPSTAGRPQDGSEPSIPWTTTTSHIAEMSLYHYSHRLRLLGQRCPDLGRWQEAQAVYVCLIARRAGTDEPFLTPRSNTTPAAQVK